MNNKGVSGVVTAVLLILLAIGAIAILWVVIASFVSNNSETIGEGVNAVNLEIDSFYLKDGSYYVKVARDTTKGDVEKVRIVLQDSDSSESYDFPESIREGEKKEILIDLSNYLDIDPNDIQSISVLPISSSGKAGKLGDELSGPGVTVWNGLVAYYPLDEDLSDESENEYTLIQDGGTITPTTGKVEGAQEFGPGGYATATLSSAIDLSELTLVGFWADTTGTPFSDLDDGTFITLNMDGAGGPHIGADNNQFAYGESQYGSNNYLILTDDKVNVVDGKFHQIAFTYSGTSGKLYVDGNEVQSGTGTGPIISTTTQIRLGTGLGGARGSLLGAMDEVRIYNRALTPEEIEYLYKNG